ncbi:hypothetical protein [Lysobacter tyrosinilyticus]
MRHAESTRDDLVVLLEELPRYALAIGAALVLLVPAARGFSPTFGWLPLWLLAMPATAWWALSGFRLPRRDGRAESVVGVRRRRAGAQARRRSRGVTSRAVARAA